MRSIANRFFVFNNDLFHKDKMEINHTRKIPPSLDFQSGQIPNIVELNLTRGGFETATGPQCAIMGPILAGRDILGCAPKITRQMKY